MQTYTYGVDDESVMEKLINELDLGSAIDRLMKIGFFLKQKKPKSTYQFTRTTVVGTEVLLLRVDEKNHFVINIADCNNEEYTETISTWDQWVDFVRMLIGRLILLVKQGKQI